MSRRTAMFVGAPIMAAMIGLAFDGLTGCVVCSPDPLDVSEPVDLGIDADLHAVVRLDLWQGERRYEFLAVGASGTVVAWGTDYTGNGHEPVVDVFDLGDLDLRAAWIDARWDQQSWWVVGDGAQLLVSHDRGAIWDAVELPTNADLHGIVGFAGRPIVVGNDVIAMRTLDGTWTQLEPPIGSWGQLRSIDANTTRVLAVGLDGVIWSTIDPSGAWTLEASGVTTDLLAVSGGVVVGRQGTMLRRNETDDGWTLVETGVTVDLVGYSGARLLGANGEIYEAFNPSKPLKLVDTHPGARGLSGNFDGWAAVGDGGWASSPPSYNCY